MNTSAPINGEEIRRREDLYILDKFNEDMVNGIFSDPLQETVDELLAERGKRYGNFEGHASISQAIKAEMRATRNWENLSEDKKECLEMVAHKIGRILNGDPEYKDSWTDIIGYVTLVEKTL